jgi:hypothetical protein
MVQIQKATSEHFEAVYQLFGTLNDQHNSKKDWENLFIDHFNSGETYFGYVLLDNQIVVGFLGLIFSKRRFKHREIKFCNIGNWVVSPEYRNKSINLLFPVLKTEDCVLTNFTASPTVCKIFKTLKFNELGEQFYIIPPLPNVSFLKGINKKLSIFYGDRVEPHLVPDDLKIFKDHSHPDFKCKHILFKSALGTCYIVAKRAYRKRLPFLHIHYISNAKVFSEHIDLFRMVAPFKFQVTAIIVDQRFLQEETVKHVIPYQLQSPRFYKSNIKNDCSDLNMIDHLYSEFVVLHI